MNRKIIKSIKNLNEDIYVGERLKQNGKALRFVSLFMALVMVVFVVINYLHGDTVPTHLSAISALAFFAVAIIAKVSKTRDVPVIFICVAITFSCTLFIVQGTSDGFASLWVTVLPIAIMYFLSVKYGIICAIYFFVLLVSLFWTPLRENVVDFYSPVFIERFPLLYLCIVIIDSVAMIQYHNTILAQIRHDEKMAREVERQSGKAKERGRKISEMSYEMIEALVKTIDAKDTYTRDHSLRVSRYSVALARALGWDEESVAQLRYDALIHDIGKISIPDDVLNKPGKLTDEEFAGVKAHTNSGFDIFESFTAFPSAKLVARHHHEWYNGTGYPDGLREDDIPASARIVMIADSFDAMNSDRVYRKALSREEIIKELEKGSGTQFDPEYVKVFIDLLKNEQVPSNKTS